MGYLSFDNVGIFLILSTFIFYQQLHLKNFRGASKGFEALLGTSVLLGMVFSIGFLVYFGWSISWVGALAIFGVSIIGAGFIGAIAEKLFGGLPLSLLAFVAWPVCAYLLVTGLPK